MLTIVSHWGNANHSPNEILHTHVDGYTLLTSTGEDVEKR